MPTFSARARRVSAVITAATLGLAGALVIAPAANAATINVNSLNDSGAGSLREAINDANSSAGPDDITFSVTGTITLHTQILITGGVTIHGPGLSSLTITRDDDVQMFLVDMASAGQDVDFDGISFDGGGAISTQRGINVVNAIPARNVTLANSDFGHFHSTVEGGTVRVFGLTGNLAVDNTDFHDNPGTLEPSLFAENVAGSTSVSNSAFYGNSGETSGGICILGGGAVSVSNSSFSGNTTSNGGAGGYISSAASVTVTGSSFVNNSSTGNRAGALYIEASGVVSIQSSSFATNQAGIVGGAIYTQDLDSLDVVGSTFTSNSSGRGGAIYLTDSGIATVRGNTFSQNQALGDGGAIYVADLSDTVTVDRNLFDSNTSGGDGGALQFDYVDQNVSVSFNTFSNNTANGSNGGALGVFDISGPDGKVYLRVHNDTFNNNLTSSQVGGKGTSIGVGTIHSDGTLEIVNSTFFEPNPLTSPAIAVSEDIDPDGGLVLVTSTVVGNGALSVDTNNGNVAVIGSIIDGDGAGADPLFVNVGARIGLEWSILTSAVDATFVAEGSGNQANTDPQLGALANNGGPTRTMLPAAASPAVNFGNPGYNFPFTEDQRGSGFARVAAGRIDIGAVERQTPAALPTMGLVINPLLPIGAALVLLLGAGLVLVARRRRSA